MREEGVWETFSSFHPLYQRVRASNLESYRRRHPGSYGRVLRRLVEETRKGKTYGNWNDYGRLLDY